MGQRRLGPCWTRPLWMQSLAPWPRGSCLLRCTGSAQEQETGRPVARHPLPREEAREREGGRKGRRWLLCQVCRKVTKLVRSPCGREGEMGVPGPLVSLAVKGGRARRWGWGWGWGGGQEGECHFWSHSAIQRKFFLKIPGCKGPKLVFCRVPGSVDSAQARDSPHPGVTGLERTVPPSGHPVRKQEL